jgi:putative hemolysin
MSANPEFLLRLAAVAALLGLSAFFAGSEAALFSLGRFRVQNWEEKYQEPARWIHELLLNPRRLIATVLIGNEFSNYGISIMIAALYTKILLESGQASAWLPARHQATWVSLLSIATSALAITLVAEILPKTLGVKFSAGWARRAAWPLHAFSHAVFPLRRALRWTSDLILRGLGVDSKDAAAGIGDEELVGLVEMGEDEGVLEAQEATLLHNLFEFGDLHAAEVMAPRRDIFCLSEALPFPEIIRQVRKAGFSRVPIYRRDPDDIIGILTVKDLLKAAGPEGAAPVPPLERLLRPAFYIPRTKPIDELLVEFQNRRVHLALVVDEFGAIVGLVTIEDILEEIFGKSGRVTKDQEFEALPSGNMLISGRLEVREFNSRMVAELPAEGIQTIGGFLLHRFGRMPAPGESLQEDGFRFTVQEVRAATIHRIEVSRIYGGREKPG